MVRGQRVSTEIVGRIAAREGVNLEELHPRLFDVIDADALDTLMDGVRDQRVEANVRVEFRYSGYEVTVERTTGVTIEKAGPDGTMADDSQGGCPAE